MPRAEVKSAVGDGDGQGDVGKGRFGVSGHIVEALHSMIIEWLVFRDNVVEDLVEIVTYVGICVLVYGQAAGSVLYEYVEEATLG